MGVYVEGMSTLNIRREEVNIQSLRKRFKHNNYFLLACRPRPHKLV